MFLDHTIVLVHHLDSAAEQYRQLGFTLTARGGHPKLGTANHTIMLEHDYIELLAVLERTAGNDRWAAALDRGEGLGAIALGTRDAGATREALMARGFEIPPVLDFDRPVALADGEFRARFSVVHLPAEASPAIPAFFCQHHTRELVWRPEWQRHANTALGIAGMTVIHPAPDQAAPGYERLLGRARVHPHPGGLSLDVGGSRIWLVSPAYAAARLGPGALTDLEGSGPVGLTVTVRDLTAAAAHLGAHGVPFRPFGSRSILIAPGWTSGVHLELLAA